MEGMTWYALPKGKEKRAILSICPNIHFAVHDIPSKKQRDAQEKILGFKWTILKEKEKEKTMRRRDEIETEVEAVEFHLRNTGKPKATKQQWESYLDALKWVLLYPPEFRKSKEGD